MAVSLARALAIARLIEEAEADRAQYELGRAVTLTAEGAGSGKGDRGSATAREKRRLATSG